MQKPISPQNSVADAHALCVLRSTAWQAFSPCARGPILPDLLISVYVLKFYSGVLNCPISFLGKLPASFFLLTHLFQRLNSILVRKFFFIVIKTHNMRPALLTHFKVYSTVSFTMRTLLESRSLELFHLALLKLYPLSKKFPISLLSQALATNILLVFMSLCVLDTSYKRNHAVLSAA